MMAFHGDDAAFMNAIMDRGLKCATKEHLEHEAVHERTRRRMNLVIGSLVGIVLGAGVTYLAVRG